MAFYTLRGIDPELWKKLKVKAIQENTTLKVLIEARFKAWLAEQE